MKKNKIKKAARILMAGSIVWTLFAIYSIVRYYLQGFNFGYETPMVTFIIHVVKIITPISFLVFSVSLISRKTKFISTAKDGFL